MTDAHCHMRGDATRHFLCAPLPESKMALSGDVLFFGIHPWHLDSCDTAEIRRRLEENPRAGVGEIGLDRLRERNISERMRRVFEEQLRLAVELRRPVALHGAKCWGQVVAALAGLKILPPAALFHGFSRSDGLIPKIVECGGYVSVSPAILNDHAVNYRELAKKLPIDRLLVETDRTAENASSLPPLSAIVAELARLRSMAEDALIARLEDNASRFCEALNN